MEAPEEEEDIDLMNDETFGGDIDGVYIIHCIIFIYTLYIADVTNEISVLREAMSLSPHKKYWENVACKFI